MVMHDKITTPKLVAAASDKDYWKVTSDVVIRYHDTPRTHLYTPDKDDFPIPLDFIDVMRSTYTNLDFDLYQL